MFLKRYQHKVVTALKQFYRTARETKNSFEAASKTLPEGMRHTLNWVEQVFNTVGKEYRDKCKNGLNEWYPRIVMKVPTGGGKTLLAVEAIREYQNLFAQKRTGLVVWIVPTETIYTQTVKKLRDKGNPLRQLLDQCSGNRTLILEKGQKLTSQDIDENLVILFVMIQSISRHNAKEALKVFQDSGGYEGFFPQDNRNDLHEELLKKYPNLDRITQEDAFLPLIKTSLGNAIRVSNPFIIIDEIHKVFSDMARGTIDSLNPEMVLGLTATPKAEMNILVTITGLELKDEDMVKLDMHILPPARGHGNDWKPMVKEIKSHREKLEKKAEELHGSKGIYIRPIALVQVEATGKEQRGKHNRVHSLDVKEFLVSLGINEDEVAIKTSAQNDIEDVDLFSPDCPVRYLITKEALREGWDCSFAYILGIIPNVNSDTGITQLVGRILRQPNAEKTKVKELDESYVYYSRGDTRQMLDRVVAGFRNEGLEDLVTNVKINNRENINQTKTVKIKRKYRSYEYAFYLPVWVMMDNGGKKRRFSYSTDIKAALDFNGFKLNDELINNIDESLSEENRERQSFAITLNRQSKADIHTETAAVNEDGAINIDYLTRRYAELMENPFLARRKAEEHVAVVRDRLGEGKLNAHFSHVASMLHRALEAEKSRQEEALFLNYLDSDKLVLAVSNDAKIGYHIPQTDLMTVGPLPSTYQNYLYEDVDFSTMNTLERQVGDILDRQEKILWWFRNKANNEWYAIQGWQQYKIRPDFVAAKKKGSDKVELVYVVESKGEHLAGNADTVYKKNVMDKMTEQHRNGKIKSYPQLELPLGSINDKAEFYLIESDKEESEIRRLFK